MYRPGGTEGEGKADKVLTGAGWVRRVVDWAWQISIAF